MVVPGVGTGIEERHKPLRLWVYRGDIGSLKSIAVKAGQSEISRSRFATVFLSDDMIWLMREVGVLFTNEAIFTQAM